MRLSSFLRDFLSRTLPPGIKSKIRNILQQRALFEKGPFLSHVAARAWPSRFEAWHRKRTFKSIYRDNRWGQEQGAPFYSGAGSRGEPADIYVEHISGIISQLGNELGRPVTVVDLGCGDFWVGRQLIGAVGKMIYIGCDIVPEIIERHTATESTPNISFRLIDIVTDELPKGDIILVRQVLQHLSNSDVTRVLGKLGDYKAVYISESQPLYLEGPSNPDKSIGAGMRFDWQTGRGRGLELDKPPFNLPVEEIFRTSTTQLDQIVTYRAMYANRAIRPHGERKPAGP